MLYGLFTIVEWSALRNGEPLGTRTTASYLTANVRKIEPDFWELLATGSSWEEQ